MESFCQTPWYAGYQDSNRYAMHALKTLLLDAVKTILRLVVLSCCGEQVGLYYIKQLLRNGDNPYFPSMTAGNPCSLWCRFSMLTHTIPEFAELSTAGKNDIYRVPSLIT